MTFQITGTVFDLIPLITGRIAYARTTISPDTFAILGSPVFGQSITNSFQDIQNKVDYFAIDPNGNFTLIVSSTTYNYNRSPILRPLEITIPYNFMLKTGRHIAFAVRTIDKISGSSPAQNIFAV